MFDYVFVQTMIKHKHITAYTYRLFVYLLSITNKNEDFLVKRFTHQEIGEGSSISRSNVGKGLKQLVEANVLIKKDRDYYFNPDLFKK